jgi:hypothetical protein
MREHCRQLDASVETSRPRGFVVREKRLRLVRHLAAIASRNQRP